MGLNDSFSWGYVTAGQPVTRNACDLQFGADRLCWHTDSGNIKFGYRCGSTTVFDATFERIVYQAN